MTETLDLFASAKGAIQKIALPDATLVYLPALFDQATSEQYLQALTEQTVWNQETITLYGKTYPVPRLSAWHGDRDKHYTYSGISAQAKPWSAELLAIRQQVETAFSVRFNAVLVNLYRHGADSVAWHSDDEPELGKLPQIASVSFGQARTFQMRHKKHQHQRYALRLASGSCLFMSGRTQQFWQHQIPKEASVSGARINLTFRMIK